MTRTASDLKPKRELNRHLVTPGKGDSLSASTGDSDSYQDWRTQFIAQRLRVLYLVGLIVNPIFIGLDVLAYAEHLRELLILRALLESGLLAGFLGLRFQLTFARPEVLLALWVLIPNICIVHMVLALGDFNSTYYNGLALVMLTAAVVVPVSWRSHLVAQTGTLLYFYTALVLHGSTAAMNGRLLTESIFFLVFYCVALQISLILYERLQTGEFRARRALETSNQKLQELDRMKSDFFANISHELRTPLTVSFGAFKTLLKRPLPPEDYGIVQSGLRNTSRLLFLINELLELARFESGRTDMRKVCVDLVALVKNVAANFESSERQRIFLDAAQEPFPLEVDVRKMMKVIYNLLANAFKFSDPNQGLVWISLTTENSHVRIAIRDNGIGIPEEQLDRIFERFTQVEGDAMRRFEGSGIGLALAKEIVTLHQGHITVESTLGKGSTFTVILPRGTGQDIVPLEEDETLVLPSTYPHDSYSPGPVLGPDDTKSEAPLVLVVDDNADMRAYLARLLTGEYRVLTATNGNDALIQVQQHGPALVVADIMMPIMTGHDLLQEMRKEEALRTIPVILLTARAGTEARVESLEAGADDYVSKPFHEEELLARIKNQLRIHRQERELEARAKELENLYAKLEGANAELRDLNVRKSEFVSIVSHDLRTPLSAIAGFVENLLSELGGPLSAKQRHYLERIQVNIGRLVRMINDLLDLATIEAGTIEFRPTPVLIRSLVESLVENLQAVAREKGVDLRVEAASEDWLVQADPDKLTQVLTNLVHNACKFTPTGGEVRIALSMATDGCVRLCVSDTGCGISPSDLGHVFEKFYSGRSSSTGRRGTGLGLAIAKHFVELHHGRIWVESQEQQGSQFYFTVPTHFE
jgi:signal transduction histidine kinase